LKAKKEHLEAAKSILQFIDNHDQFLLSGHINADGDAVAAVIATGLLLKKLNKTYYMVFHDKQIDKRFDYLKNFNAIYHFDDSLNLAITAAIILDVPGINRLGDVEKLLPHRSKIAKIDHHPSESDFADYNMLDENASSTTQLIYEIIEMAAVTIDLDLANAIYTGIVYDTGRFSFSNTTSRDMYIAGNMIDLGVKPSKINNRIFFENSFHALRTIGQGLAQLESYFDGAVNVIYLDYEAMSRNHHGEIEELANYSVAIRGGRVGLFVREIKPGIHKVSFRSKDDIDVNKVAKVFNGGGHSRAAGCRVDGTKDEVLKLILDELKKNL
jgi:phosphoesterase RecJ-like protein